MRWLKRINLNFSDKTMERAYLKIKDLNRSSDFNVTLSFLILMNLLLAVPALIREQMDDLLIGLGMIISLIVVFLLRNKFSYYLQYLTLGALLAYNLSRLILVKSNYNTTAKGSLLFQGYVLATVQSVIIGRINNVLHRFYATMVFLGLRLGILMAYIDNKVFDPVSIIRQTSVDLFLTYMCFSAEKTERNVFRNFYQNQEELRKFKELLDDSLPQSVAVLDWETTEPLFMNNAFKDTVEHGNDDADRLNSEMPLNTYVLQCYFSNFIPDLTTLREVGVVHGDLDGINIDGSNTAMDLKRTLEMLIRHNILTSKAISVTTSYVCNSQRRLFEVILKKVKWNGLDAVAVILNDITYQENLIALRVSNVSKDKIIATMSHELRTPIHGIIGFLQTIEKKVRDPEVLMGLSLCKDNADFLLNILNSVLDYHQISTNKMRLKPNRISLTNTLKDVLRIFDFQSNQKGLSLELAVSRDIPETIVTDENRLKEILVNLLANAVKFTFRGGIKVQAVKDQEEPELIGISVTDTGVGMKEDTKAKLFQIKGAGEDKESVNKNGVGFGLTISNALAKKLCGKDEEIVMRVTSEYGKGSTFSFQILKDLEASKQCLNVRFERMQTCKEEQEEEHVEEAILEKEREYTIMKKSQESEVNYSQDDDLAHDIGSKMASYASFQRKPVSDSVSCSSKMLSLLPAQPANEMDGILIKKFNNQQEHFSRSLSVYRLDGRIMENSTSKSSILVVDDSPFNLLIAKNLIGDLGYRVKTAGGGHQAIEILKSSKEEEENIKVILMDCQMPIMDGYETTRILMEMMKKNEIQKVPILAWTANNSEEDIERCYECGMIAHLSKPTSKEEILKALAKLS